MIKRVMMLIVGMTCLVLVGFVSTGRAKDKPAEGRYTLVDLGVFNDMQSRAFAINNHGQVIGDDTNGKAFIVNPLDSDGDGEPDTWFADEDEDGTNDLMIGLGTLLTNENGDSSYVYASGINDSGQVVGAWKDYVEMPSGGKLYLSRSFIITPEDRDGDGVPDTWFADDNGDGANDLMVNLGLMKLDSLSAYSYGYAHAISNSGYVVGGVSESNVTFENHAYVIAPEDSDGDGEPDTWFKDEDGDGYNDMMIDLGKLGGDHRDVDAFDVSDSGEVVGQSEAAGGRWYVPHRAYILTPEDSDGDGEPDTWFKDEDGDGANDLMTELEALVEDGICSARAINSFGQVVGWSDCQASYEFQGQAVVWEADTTTPTGLPGDIKGGLAARGINDFGQIVGYGSNMPSVQAIMNSPDLSEGTFNYAAVLWEDGVMTLLNQIIDNAIGTDDLTAMDINNSGQIVGRIYSGIYHAYIAVPIP